MRIIARYKRLRHVDKDVGKKYLNYYFDVELIAYSEWDGKDSRPFIQTLIDVLRNVVSPQQYRLTLVIPILEDTWFDRHTHKFPISSTLRKYRKTLPIYERLVHDLAIQDLTENTTFTKIKQEDYF